MDYGIISVIPVAILLITAITTKRITEPLMLSSAVGILIIHKTAFIPEFINAIYEVLGDPTIQWFLLFAFGFGAFVNLLELSGGAFGFGKFILRFVNTERKSLLATWIMGVIVFIDDYLNALAVGAVMRNVTDRYDVPRELLAYIVNSTGSPICVIIPFSSWAAFTMGVLKTQGLESKAYISAIPFIVYGWVAIIICLLVALRIFPLIGPMKKAYIRAKEGDIFPEGVQKPQIDTFDEQIAATTQEEKRGAKLRDFLIPMAVLVAGIAITRGDLIIGIFIALISQAVLYLGQRVISFDEFMDGFFEGIKSMIPLSFIIIFAFILNNANGVLGFSEYIISIAKPYLIGGVIPAITFLVVGFLAFTASCFWPLVALTVPIFIPLAQIFNVNIYLTIGAIVSGVTFGSHCCFYSDAVLMTSTSAQIRPMDQIVAILPYTLIGAAISTIIYLILGFTV